MHLKLVGLRQHGHRGCRGVHAALSLSGWYTLDAMDTRLVLQRTVDVGSRDGKVNLLVAAHSTLADTGDGELPPLRVAEALVHLEQVSRKQAGLVATCSGANLHLHILRILWILWNECNLDFLFQLWLQLFVGSQLIACHLLHLWVVFVGQYVLGLLDAVQAGNVALAGVHDVAQVFIFLR